MPTAPSREPRCRTHALPASAAPCPATSLRVRRTGGRRRASWVSRRERQPAAAVAFSPFPLRLGGRAGRVKGLRIELKLLPSATAQRRLPSARLRSEGSHENAWRNSPVCDGTVLICLLDGMKATARSFRARAAYPSRASAMFFSSAMAFAGSRPLGQALVQFMIVWQR